MGRKDLITGEYEMCSAFTQRTSPKKVEAALGVPILNSTGEIEWTRNVRLTTPAVALIDSEGGVEAKNLVFPSRPFPNSRLSGAEAKEGEDSQIIRIYERPTWAKGFESQRALVPMTSFDEPAYWGPLKGAWARFSVPEAEVFFSAAIQIKSYMPAGKPGFSLLTHTATEQMLKYHHRLIVILKAKDALSWLRGGKAKPLDKFNFLLKHRYQEELDVTEDRKMGKGWEKRVKEHEASLEEEEAYAKVLKSESVQG